MKWTLLNNISITWNNTFLFAVNSFEEERKSKKSKKNKDKEKNGENKIEQTNTKLAMEFRKICRQIHENFSIFLRSSDVSKRKHENLRNIVQFFKLGIDHKFIVDELVSVYWKRIYFFSTKLVVFFNETHLHCWFL